MDAHSLGLTIDAREMATKVFLAVKRFDPTVLMGAALLHMREGNPFDIHLDNQDREEVLVRLIGLLEELDRQQVSYEISVNNVPRSSHLWESSQWSRSDVVSALETFRRQKIAAEEARQRHQERYQQWLSTSEGKEHDRAKEVVDRTRDVVHSRWDVLGFDDLRPSEKEYLYIWWLCVEVSNGTFHQYFSNSTGDSALLALSALETIGANEAHAILMDALHQFESVGGFTADRTERQDRLDALPDEVFEQATRRLHRISDDPRTAALVRVAHDFEQHGIVSQVSR
ncbi:MAG: DMP19 family protein [Fimbriiglobus sp.]